MLLIDEGLVHWAYENTRWKTQCGTKFDPAETRHRRNMETPTCLVCVARSKNFIL